MNSPRQIRFIGGELDGDFLTAPAGQTAPVPPDPYVRPAKDQSGQSGGLVRQLVYRLDQSQSPPAYKYCGPGYWTVVEGTEGQLFFEGDMPPVYSEGRFDSQGQMTAINRYRYHGKADSAGRGILEFVDALESPSEEQRNIETAKRRYWNYKPEEVFSNNIHLHPQVTIRDGADRKAEVDEALAPVILACWKNNWETYSSCQAQPADWTHPGYAYISFATSAHREQFANRLRAAGLECIEQDTTGLGYWANFSPDLSRVVDAIT